MNKKIRLWMVFLLLTLAVGGMGITASAAKKTGWQRSGSYYTYYSTAGKLTTGWKKISGKIYYFRTEKEGKAPKGSRVTGLYQIGKKRYYFDKSGVMKLGWQTVGGKNYYFAKTGKAGKIGAAYTGFKKIGNDYFLFKDDGTATVGWGKYKEKKYFFSNSTKLGVRGRALKGWKDIGSARYYFSTTGVMQKNRWISSTYYLGSDGKMLKSTVTPDGYVVDSSGKKLRVAKGWIKDGGKYYYYVSGKKTTGWKTISGQKYYFNEDGVRQNGWITVDGAKYYLKSSVMQTGWQTIGGKYYYFESSGKMAVNTTVDGVEIGADGVAKEKPENAEVGTEPSKPKASILLIAGHGQGDSGATGTYGKTTYYEYKLTREFASLIEKKLKAGSSSISVTMYNQSYDCYQVLSGKKKGPKPDLKKYDYVLEIHFNATAVASKDSKGDGKVKGVGMYVNSAKKKTTLDQNIVKAVSKTGFKIWGGGTGIFKSSGLFNAKTCQGKGVSYGLLETAFIDDKDDITFYNKNKDKMAQAVANAIISYYK